MKNLFRTSFKTENRKTTWRFLYGAIFLTGLALLVGISDNPPGIIILYLGFICFFLAFVHHWQKVRPFVILLIVSFIGLPVFGVLHNVFHGLHVMTGDIIIISQLLVFLSVSSFLIALIACPPGILVGGIGSIVRYMKGRKSHRPS